MALQKSFWKKYESLIVGLITLLLIYFIVVFNQKINFLLGNELIVYLTPSQKSFVMHYGNVSHAKFDVTMDNAAYCKAHCSYSFNDRSRNEIIDNGAFELQKDSYFIKNYSLSVKRLGSGQDIYSFDVICRSIRSFFCLTKGDEKSRSSLIIVNYDLTETEKELKKLLKQNVTHLLEELSTVDVLHQILGQKYFEFGFKVNLNDLSKQKIGIDGVYDKTRISIENLRSLWAIEDYLKLSELFNESLSENLNDIKNSIANLNKEVDSTAELHNNLLLRLNFLFKGANELNNILSVLDSEEYQYNLYLTADNISKITSSMNTNSFDNYSAIDKEISNVTREQNSLIEKTKIPAAALFFNTEYSIKFGSHSLCSLNLSCKENISIANMIKNTEEFFDKYPNSISLKQTCNSLKELNQTYSNIRNQTIELIKNSSIIFPSDIEFLSLANSFRDNKAREINNSYIDSFEKIILENNVSNISLIVINITNLTLPKNKSDIIQVNDNKSKNLSLYLLSQLNVNDETKRLLDSCSKIDSPLIKIDNISFEFVSTNITYKIVSKIDTNLSDNPPVCCVFNECKPCCRDDSCKNDAKTFPIIFLHGHSFAKDNSPEFSLDSFNKLQIKLQEDGWLNAGIVSLYSQNEQLQEGIWGLSGKPVAVKVSYYYDAFRKDDKYITIPTKSENIDTYALRLRDLIEIVKERTNKPKVNIIAHSMGGLVARRYMQIFGEEDVDKLIMIATPNHGLSGSAADYCRVAGENRECYDMIKDSLFINKLNDPSKQPKNVRLYDVIGNGCSTNKGGGDGIVVNESALIENAKLYFVNGTCGGIFGSLLHTDILNVEMYPETYKIIKGILMD